MNQEELSTKYREITIGTIETSRTIHVFVREGKEFHLVKVLAIANPVMSDGEIKLHECKNGTTGKEILSLPLEILTGEKPSPDKFLFRIPR